MKEAGAALPERVVVRLLAVLAVAAGCLDAVCVIRLGNVFASVITGNLVQLGRAIATTDARLAAQAATAVGSYAAGVAAGTFSLPRDGAGWRRHTSLAACVELVLLAGLAAGWLATSARPGRVAALVMLGLAGAAMGVQSSVTLSCGVRGASTTYLTGTLTSVVRAATADPRRVTAGGITRLVALLCGAAVGALLLRAAPAWAPAVPAALVAAVVAAAAAHGRQRSGGS